MTNRRTWIRRALIAGSVGIGTHQLWRHGHDYVFMEQFQVVEPGKIYRGAWQKPWPMRRLRPRLQDQDHPGPGPSGRPPPVRPGAGAGARAGIRWIHIPIIDQRGTKIAPRKTRSPICSIRRRPSSPIPRTIRSSSTAITG